MLLVPWDGAAAVLWAVVDREIESDMVDSNDLMDTKNVEWMAEKLRRLGYVLFIIRTQ